MKSNILLCLFSLMLVVGLSGAQQNAKKFKYARCDVRPNPSIRGNKVQGTVFFRQKIQGGKVEYKLLLSGFNTKDGVFLHGFHVHNFGTVLPGCEAAGGHYNPKGVNHGSQANNKKKRHIGDLGNIEEDITGAVSLISEDRFIALFGKHNIIGRAVMVHAGEDDLGLGGDEGSLKTGNAGARLACCTIAVSDGTGWED